MLWDVFQILQTLRENLQESTWTRLNGSSIVIREHTWKSDIGNCAKLRGNPSNVGHSKMELLKPQYSWSRHRWFVELSSKSTKSVYIYLTSPNVLYYIFWNVSSCSSKAGSFIWETRLVDPFKTLFTTEETQQNFHLLKEVLWPKMQRSCTHNHIHCVKTRL